MERDRLRQILLFGGGTVLGIVGLIVAISLLSTTISRNRSAQEPSPQPAPVTTGQVPEAPDEFIGPRAAAELDIFLPEIVIPNEVDAFWLPPWQPYRERQSQWSVDDVREYWIDPVEIGTETLAEQNRRRVQAYLDSLD